MTRMRVMATRVTTSMRVITITTHT
jgi:hypothetical protein